MLRKIPCGKCLNGEAHVHNLRRVSVAGGKVHKPPFGNQVQRSAVRHAVAGNVFPAFISFHGEFFQIADVDFHVKVPGVAKNRTVFHAAHRTFGNDIATAGHGNEQIADLCRLFHRHNGKAVHNRLHGFHGVHFGDNDLCAEPFCPHGNAFAAPTVARDHNGLSGDNQVGCAVDAVKYGLPRAVAVVEQIFTLRVIDRHHREQQLFVRRHRAQANDAGGGLLAAADDVREQLRIGVVN